MLHLSPLRFNLSKSSSHSSSFKRRILIGLLVVVASMAGLTAVRANTITVNSTTDSLTTNGSCSIREAIINANNDAATWPDCAAGSGLDTINLPAGTITFAIPNLMPTDIFEEANLRGDLDISSSLTINGNAAGTTINANAFDRIFDINPDVDQDPVTLRPLITVHINDLTITNGYQNQSGAVRVQASATAFMDNCTVSNSTSWADDGGGVYIFSDGILTMTNCTVSGNSALLLGGGIANFGTLNMISCTITNNTGVHNRAQGVACDGVPCGLRNTIIAGNGAANRADTEGFINSLGYNIIGRINDDLNNPITNITPTTGDQIGVGAAVVNLGALANNGGPTPTHALGAGSIAIDKGESSGSIRDQRGETRPCDQAIPNATGGDGADIGAFEVQGVCAGDNSAPNAVDDAAMVAEDSGANTIFVLTNDTDPDMDTLIVTAVTQGAHGSVAIGAGGANVTYTPAADYFGSDSFTYTISDGNGHTDTATVDVTVTNVNDPPIATGENYNTNSNTPLNVLPPGVLANDTDIDGGPLTAQLVGGPAHAAVFALNPNGGFSYTPTFNYAGPDSFTYRAFDGTDYSNTVTVNINVIDTVPPDVTASVAQSVLWPPNHDLENVGLSISATDNGGGPVTIQIAVFSDEDDLAPASGNFSPDAKNIAAGTLRLRSERSGSGDGRVYLIVITAADSLNNVSHTCLTVVVPKSQSQADKDAVNAEAAAAHTYCEAHGGAPPPGYFVVGDGPVVGPKQ